MVQAMLSGCLVASVIPEVDHISLAGLLLPLEASDEAVPATQIEAGLRNMTDKELKQKVLAAFIYARRHFVPDAVVDDVLEIVDKWDAGGRGYLVSTIDVL
jgi:hypothetical protein